VLVVDSSVWIGFFNGADTPAVDLLSHLLDHAEVRLVVPDLVLFEVLRGFRHERDLRAARQLMSSLSVEATLGPTLYGQNTPADLCLQACDHYRALRGHGFTIRSALDVLVASFCIENDYALLHHDRDFDAFEQWRGLRVWRH